jgi:uncharacterized membrane protein YeaQ/YmgE (transglycosylase-associated protein family)
MFGFIGAILIGLFVGLVARLLMPGKSVQGFVMTSLLGIAGAVVGRWVGEAVGWYRPEEGVGFFMAVLGSMLILFAYQLFRGLQNH